MEAKEFVPYNQALALKELGFDEHCNTCYDKLQMVSSYGKNVFDYKNYNTSGYVVSRPTYSQAFRWFREKHNLFSYIELFTNEDNIVMYEFIIYSNQVNPLDAKDCFTYEEAEYYCLNKLIELTFKSE